MIAVGYWLVERLSYSQDLTLLHGVGANSVVQVCSCTSLPSLHKEEQLCVEGFSWGVGEFGQVTVCNRERGT